MYTLKCSCQALRPCGMTVTGHDPADAQEAATTFGWTLTPPLCPACQDDR